MTNSDDDLKKEFNRQTSKISWQELQPFYARGAVVRVSAEMDLIEVAIAMHRDDRQQMEAWLADARVERVDDEQARCWLDADTTLWAVVVAPWVLVQELSTNVH